MLPPPPHPRPWRVHSATSGNSWIRHWYGPLVTNKISKKSQSGADPGFPVREGAPTLHTGTDANLKFCQIFQKIKSAWSFGYRGGRGWGRSGEGRSRGGGAERGGGKGEGAVCSSRRRFPKCHQCKHFVGSISPMFLCRIFTEHFSRSFSEGTKYNLPHVNTGGTSSGALSRKILAQHLIMIPPCFQRYTPDSVVIDTHLTLLL